jgi:1,4-dihydroxy-2-naphthoate octaprenyltransferase
MSLGNFKATIGIWFLASRPVTLTASAVPVILGTSLAAGSGLFSWQLFACAFIGSIFIQIGTNLADEYTDHRKSGELKKFPAPHKVIQRGLLSERAVLMGTLFCFAVGSSVGLYIVYMVGWPILAIGIASVSVGYLYSSGPIPLGNWALGELTVFIFMGPLIVMASYFVQIESFSVQTFWQSIPIGLLVTSILQANNLRDIHEDRSQGKHTLTTIFGESFGRNFYSILTFGSHVFTVGLILYGYYPWTTTLLFLALPQLAVTNRKLRAAKEKMQFNLVLITTAKLHFVSGLLIATGILIGIILKI